MYIQQVGNGSVPEWCPHWRCRYRHHTFMCRKYHVKHTCKQGNLDRLFVCLFVCWNKTRKTLLRLLCWEGSKPPGSDHTRAEAQITCVPKTAVHTMCLSI